MYLLCEMAGVSEPIQFDSQNSEEDNTEVTCSRNEGSGGTNETIGRQAGAPQTPDKAENDIDSDVLVIDDSPELSDKLDKQLNVSVSTTNTEQRLSDIKEGTTKMFVKSSSDPQLDSGNTISGTQQHSEGADGNTTSTIPGLEKSEPAVQASANATDVMGSVLPSGTSGPTLHRSVSAPADESNLNQAALTLLKRLEFKNPGRKQMDYGTFNPEESEREKKKLRRFQTAKPRGNVCYKEDGTLFDGRNICDCLNEDCPGCFYPCPQCSSPRCGPTCRSNRKWVYDYIEDEGRNYRVEFPEAAVNFGM